MTGHQALLAELASADWDVLLPRLIDCAAKRLWRVGWAEGRDGIPAAMSAKEIVNKAIENCLAGERTWNPSVNLETFLRGVIKSLISSAKKAAGRRKEDAIGDDITTLPDQRAPDDGKHDDDHDEDEVEASRSAILAAATACAEDDPDLSDYYVCVTSDDGPAKREDIAQVLGWTVDRVSAARVKLKRRLQSKYPKLCEDAKKGRPR